eukprot:3089897-Amphidinium_carterae.2
MASHPLYLNVSDSSQDTVLHSGMSSPRFALSKLQLVGHYRRPLAVGHNDSLSLQTLASEHDGMQLCLVDRLPTPRQGVCDLGSLSGDTAAALSVVGLSWVLTTAIGEQQGILSGTGRRLYHSRQFLRELDSKSKSLHTGGNLLSESAHLCLFPLCSEERAVKHHMLWRTNALIAEGTGRVFIEDPSPTIIHPKATTGGVDHRP